MPTDLVGEFEVDDGRVVSLNRRGDKLDIEVWHSCGKCVEHEIVVDLVTGKVQRIGGSG